MTRIQSNLVSDFMQTIKTEMPEAAALGDRRLREIVENTLHGPALDHTELLHTAALLQKLISLIKADLLN